MADEPAPFHIHLTFSGEDAKSFLRFMEEAGYTNKNIGARALIAGALTDYPKWGVFTAERRAEYFEFKSLMKEAWATKLAEIKQGIEDEIALRRTGYGHADQER